MSTAVVNGQTNGQACASDLSNSSVDTVTLPGLVLGSATDDAQVSESVSAIAPASSVTASECPAVAPNPTNAEALLPASDLEAGLVELLEMLKPWTPYLKQMTERQDEILQLLSEPQSAVPVAVAVVPEPTVVPAVVFANLNVYDEAVGDAAWLLSERLAIAEPSATQREWYRWALVQAIKGDR